MVKDYQAVSDDESSLRGDLTGLGDDVTSTEDDLTSEHSDEQNVLTEAGNGTDNSSVCGDASGVGGDASGVAGDASSFSGELQSITTGLSTLRNDATTLNRDLQVLLNIESGYAGVGSNPSANDVQRAVSGAASAASEDVREANHDLAKRTRRTWQPRTDMQQMPRKLGTATLQPTAPHRLAASHHRTPDRAGPLPE
ncbi:hypothetical protein [Streptomyces sp. 900105755]